MEWKQKIMNVQHTGNGHERVTNTLTWLEGWSYASWTEVEMYGVMSFHSGTNEHWGLYDKHTARIVAVASEDIEHLLGLMADSDDFWIMLAAQDLELQVVS